MQLDFQLHSVESRMLFYYIFKNQDWRAESVPTETGVCCFHPSMLYYYQKLLKDSRLGRVLRNVSGPSISLRNYLALFSFRSDYSQQADSEFGYPKLPHLFSSPHSLSLCLCRLAQCNLLFSVYLVSTDNKEMPNLCKSYAGETLVPFIRTRMFLKNLSFQDKSGYFFSFLSSLSCVPMFQSF